MSPSRTRHVPLRPSRPHAPVTPVTPKAGSARQRRHGSRHARHAPSPVTLTPPLVGGVGGGGAPWGLRMPREDAKARARRLLAERRVMIVGVLPTSALASVRGDSGELREVRWDPHRGWSCSCPAIGFCSHGHAVASVVLVRTEDGWRSAEDVVSTWAGAPVEAWKAVVSERPHGNREAR